MGNVEKAKKVGMVILIFDLEKGKVEVLYKQNVTLVTTIADGYAKALLMVPVADDLQVDVLRILDIEDENAIANEDVRKDKMEKQPYDGNTAFDGNYDYERSNKDI